MWTLAGDVLFAVEAGGGTHQSAHGAVQSMPVVAAELGVGALEGRVTVSLRLLDTAVHHVSAPSSSVVCGHVCMQQVRSVSVRGRSMHGVCVPVPVVLLRLVVLRRVL